MSEEGARGLGLGNNPAAISDVSGNHIHSGKSSQGKSLLDLRPQAIAFSFSGLSHPSIPVYTNVVLCSGEYFCNYLESGALSSALGGELQSLDVDRI